MRDRRTALVPNNTVGSMVVSILANTAVASTAAVAAIKAFPQALQIGLGILPIRSTLAIAWRSMRLRQTRARAGKQGCAVRASECSKQIRSMLQKFVAVAAWTCLIFIIYASLSSASARPELTESEPALAVFIERFGAYGLLGVLFRLAYPNRIGMVWILVLGSAVILELLQIVIPDRDARVIDAAEKLAGGAAGIVAARAFLPFARRLG
jgi:VanZ family protein